MQKTKYSRLVQMMALLLLAGCLEPPASPAPRVADAQLPQLEFSATDEKGELLDREAVALRPLIWVRSSAALSRELTLSLRVASKKDQACQGRTLEASEQRTASTVRVAPKTLLSPEQWHCVTLGAREVGIVHWLFRTRAVEEVDHITWPPPESRVPKNLNVVQIFSPSEQKAIENWTPSIFNFRAISVSSGARSCFFEGEDRACLQVWIAEELVDGEAWFSVVRHDDLQVTTRYWVDGRDVTAPAAQQIGCMPGAEPLLDGKACLRATASDASVFMQFNEPVLVSWQSSSAKGLARAPFGEVQFVVEQQSSRIALEVSAYDLAGNSEVARLEHENAVPPASLTLVAVRPNPRGPEPAQELLVVYNHGERVHELSDFRVGSTLSTSMSLPSSKIAPGEHVVVVPADFDPHHDADEAPPVGVKLLRLPSDLTEKGLANQGEEVQLWDEDGRWVAGIPALKASAGTCIRRIDETSHADLPRFFTHSTCFGSL